MAGGPGRMSAADAGIGLRARSVAYQPTVQELRTFAEAMPTARRTSYDNFNVVTHVLDRSKRSTFVVTNDAERYPGHALGREEGERIAALQDAWLAEQDVVVLDGFVGHAPPHRVAVRLVVERAHASIAAMQRHMYYEPVTGGRPFTPDLVTVCTPSLAVPGYPDERVVAIWLEEGVTRILNSDYFGEAKKAPLRPWGQRVHDAGGLMLHAAWTAVPTPDGERSLLVVGPSDGGKTTVTFGGPTGSRVVQDDFVGVFPGGRLVGSEDGCIEKTWRLDPANQPAIHQAATSQDAWLENVSQHGEQLDFFDESWTTAGRAVFSLGAVDRLPPGQAPPFGKLLIIHRDHTIVPCVARLGRDQAAGYYLLRELRREPAGQGAERALPVSHARQGGRLAELLPSTAVEVYLLNTGRVGGASSDERSKAVPRAHTAAVVRGIAAGTIGWDADDDFGYQIATEVPGVDEPELLCPRRLYERQGRTAEYREEVERLHAERGAYLDGLSSQDGLAPEVTEAIVRRH
jgi:phosphoenolpyruvate carboxykinase (ATP)